MCPTFTQAFEEIEADATLNPQPIHLLLGNGFSRGFDDGIFNYNSLYEAANFNAEVQSVFDLLDTRDFEHVIRTLEESSDVVECFNGDGDLQEELDEGADHVREALIDVITSTHPERPQDIPIGRLRPCAQFLKFFRDKRGIIFTLNYDIMLYWVILKSMAGEFGRELKSTFCDGCGNDPANELAGHVVYTRWMEPNVFYLHGAMFLFDDGQMLRKITNSRTEEPLIEQISDNINAGMFPLFVAEGTSSKKVEAIRRKPYLLEAIKELEKARGSLFIHGMSLSENDQHILDAIVKSKVQRVYVSYRGDLNSVSNQVLRARAQSMSAARSRNDLPLTVSFYDSGTIEVWGAAEAEADN
jgi:hypothetical protein